MLFAPPEVQQPLRSPAPMPIPGLRISDEQVFSLVNGVLPAWLLLLLAPRWRGTVPVATVTAAVFSALYVAVLAGALSGKQAAHAWNAWWLWLAASRFMSYTWRTMCMYVWHA